MVGSGLYNSYSCLQYFAACPPSLRGGVEFLFRAVSGMIKGPNNPTVIMAVFPCQWFLNRWTIIKFGKFFITDTAP